MEIISRANAQPESRFPEQYYLLHPHDHLNFQLNRLLEVVGVDNLAEVRAAAEKIGDLPDWTREMIRLAEKAVSEGRLYQGAFYYRFAEFFMAPSDPAKKTVYRQYLDLIRQVFAGLPVERHQVPYAGSCLKALRFAAPQAGGVIVFCGGFDSYVEEFYPLYSAYGRSGYDVIIFEGPGQGESLHQYGHVMTHEWEKPVRAVLDYFKTDDVTFVGVSLGGYLALRAAAFEPRIRRVVAMDVMYDFSECFSRRAGAVKGRLLKLGLALNLRETVNFFAGRQMKQDMMAEWGISHGMMVMGAKTPFDFLRNVRLYHTRNISSRVTQDVLLLAGSQDHMVPLRQFEQQKKALTRAASVTGRVFTPAEQAQNHCQVGNIKLAADYIFEWIRTRQT
jgi:alpha-beta hydrolase superfamily lysophospholipase